jgi:hypothetical protein
VSRINQKRQRTKILEINEEREDEITKGWKREKERNNEDENLMVSCTVKPGRNLQMFQRCLLLPSSER